MTARGPSSSSSLAPTLRPRGSLLALTTALSSSSPSSPLPASAMSSTTSHPATFPAQHTVLTTSSTSSGPWIAPAADEQGAPEEGEIIEEGGTGGGDVEDEGTVVGRGGSAHDLVIAQWGEDYVVGEFHQRTNNDVAIV